MHRFNLIKTLLGIPPKDKLAWNKRELTPETETFCFIKQGHVMEYIEYGRKPDVKRIVSLFFGPGETVVRCHPVFSIISPLDDGQIENINHGHILSTLRKFPEMHLVYRTIRGQYEDKVAKRINMLNTIRIYLNGKIVIKKIYNVA